MAQYPRDPRLSADGLWWWDGQRWVPRESRAAGISSGAMLALIAGGVALALVTVAVFAYVAYTRFHVSQVRVSASASPVPCDGLEHTQVHYHAAIQILNQGQAVAIPTSVGRTAYCYYWLHMHTGEPGIIHVEAPNDRAFTLGDFFRVWAAWSGGQERIDSRHVSSLTLSGAERLVVFVAPDGSAPQVFTGDPASIVLKEREVVTVEVSPPTVSPPPPFDWPYGF